MFKPSYYYLLCGLKFVVMSICCQCFCFFNDLAKTLNGYSCDIAAIYPALAAEEAAAK